MRKRASRSWKEWFIDIAADLAVSVVAAGIVSGLATVYFESRLENSKDRVASLMQSEQRFDASHNEVIAQIGIYTNKLLTTGNAPDKDKTLAAIIDAQSQLLELKSELSHEDYIVIAKYAAELNRLLNSLNAVSKPTDLNPLLTSVQRLLKDHKEIAQRVRMASNVSIF